MLVTNGHEKDMQHIEVTIFTSSIILISMVELIRESSIVGWLEPCVLSVYIVVWLEPCRSSFVNIAG